MIGKTSEKSFQQTKSRWATDEADLLTWQCYIQVLSTWTSGGLGITAVCEGNSVPVAVTQANFLSFLRPLQLQHPDHSWIKRKSKSSRYGTRVVYQGTSSSTHNIPDTNNTRNVFCFFSVLHRCLNMTILKLYLIWVKALFTFH